MSVILEAVRGRRPGFFLNDDLGGLQPGAAFLVVSVVHAHKRVTVLMIAPFFGNALQKAALSAAVQNASLGCRRSGWRGSSLLVVMPIIREVRLLVKKFNGVFSDMLSWPGNDSGQAGMTSKDNPFKGGGKEGDGALCGELKPIAAIFNPSPP
jgi:hypothetical protein